MARAITTAANLPSYAQGSIGKLKLFGFSNENGQLAWKFFEEYRLADTARRVQVRDTGTLAPGREVSQYAQAMKRGDQFPPVILTEDGYLVDGSTRTEAARKARIPRLPAFILSVNYEDAPEAMRRQFVALGASFNIIHGKRMSAANIVAIIDQVSDEDDRPADIARKLSVPLATAQTAMAAAKTARRAKVLGTELNGSLTSTHLKILGNKSDKLTGPVFREILELTQDAKLSVPAMTSLMRRTEREETEHARLAILHAERTALQGVIDGGESRPSRAARLRQALGVLISTEDPGLLVELAPGAQADHARTLEEAADRLAEVMKAQAKLARRGA